MRRLLAVLMCGVCQGKVQRQTLAVLAGGGLPDDLQGLLRAAPRFAFELAQTYWNDDTIQDLGGKFVKPKERVVDVDIRWIFAQDEMIQNTVDFKPQLLLNGPDMVTSDGNTRCNAWRNISVINEVPAQDACDEGELFAWLGRLMEIPHLMMRNAGKATEKKVFPYSLRGMLPKEKLIPMHAKLLAHFNVTLFVMLMTSVGDSVAMRDILLSNLDSRFTIEKTVELPDVKNDQDLWASLPDEEFPWTDTSDGRPVYNHFKKLVGQLLDCRSWAWVNYIDERYGSLVVAFRLATDQIGIDHAHIFEVGFKNSIMDNRVLTGDLWTELGSIASGAFFLKPILDTSAAEAYDSWVVSGKVWNHTYSECEGYYDRWWMKNFSEGGCFHLSKPDKKWCHPALTHEDACSHAPEFATPWPQPHEEGFFYNAGLPFELYFVMLSAANSIALQNRSFAPDELKRAMQEASFGGWYSSGPLWDSAGDRVYDRVNVMQYQGASNLENNSISYKFLWDVNLTFYRRWNITDESKPPLSFKAVGKFKSEVLSMQMEDLRWMTKDARSLTWLSPDCPPGQTKNHWLDPGSECVPCPAGYYRTDMAELKCSACPLGSFSGEDGSISCKQCMAGSFAPKIGSTNCTACELGTSAAQNGMSICYDCERGRYTDIVGQATCGLCEAGSYQSNSGATACDACDVHETTASAGSQQACDCICRAHFYREGVRKGCPNATHESSCNSCPEGLGCAIGSDAINFPRNKDSNSSSPFPLVAKGYWSSFDKPLEVYKCARDDQCPGGSMETCSGNMEGKLCSNCPAGWYTVGGTCTKCLNLGAASGLWAAVLFILPSILIVVWHWRSTDPVSKWNGPTQSIAALVYLILVYAQSLALIGMTRINFSSSARGLFSELIYTIDILSLLQVQCMYEASFSGRYISSELLPLIVVLYFVTVYYATRLLAKSLISLKGQASKRIQRALSLDRDILFSCCGGLCFAFFITIAQQAMILFQCYEHPSPNNQSSVLSHPALICASEEWLNLLIIGISAVLFFCILPMAVSLHILHVAPLRFENVGFQKRWKFLFIKFQPSVWYWSPVVLAKAFCMSLTTVICKRGFDQIAFLFCLFLTYLLGTILMKPWRSKHAFYMDLALHSSLLCVLLISTGFALDDMARIPEINFSVSAWIFVVLPLLCAFPALVYLFFKKVRPDSQGKHTAQAQQMVQVFSQLTSVERVSRCLYQLTEDDRAGLQKALQIVSVELAAVDDSTPRSSRLSYTRDTSEKAAKTIQAGRDAETPISNGKAAENMKQEEHLVAAVYMKDVPADLAREEIHGAEIHASV